MIESSVAQSELTRMLSEAGFDFHHPDPRLSWSVFKEFASIPVNCQDDAFLWQCGVFKFTGEDLFHWDMTRQFSFEEDGEYDHMEQLSFTIYYAPVEQLRAMKTNVWSYDFESAADFFAHVERLPQFKVPIEQHEPIRAELYQEEV